MKPESTPLSYIFLLILFIQDDLFNNSGNVSGSPTTYTIHVSNPVSGSSFDSTLSCGDSSGCSIEIPSLFCSQSAIINVTIEGANKQGAGLHSFAIIGKNLCPIVHVELH